MNTALGFLLGNSQFQQWWRKRLTLTSHAYYSEYKIALSWYEWFWHYWSSWHNHFGTTHCLISLGLWAIYFFTFLKQCILKALPAKWHINSVNCACTLKDVRPLSSAYWSVQCNIWRHFNINVSHFTYHYCCHVCNLFMMLLNTVQGHSISPTTCDLYLLHGWLALWREFICNIFSILIFCWQWFNGVAFCFWF